MSMTPADRLDLHDLMICTLHDNGYGTLVQPPRRVMAAALTTALVEAGWQPPSLTGPDDRRETER